MATIVEIEVNGEFEETADIICDLCEETCALVKRQIQNIQKIIIHGISAARFKTTVICPETGTIYKITFVPNDNLIA